MPGAFLPLTREHRDRANAYLAGMAARGFVPPPMEEVVRAASIGCPHGEPSPRECHDCLEERREAEEREPD